MNKQKYFLAEEPGSTEWYLIPVEERDNFIEWCKQEFYDDEYKKWSQYFRKYMLVDGQNNDREFIIV